MSWLWRCLKMARAALLGVLALVVGGLALVCAIVVTEPGSRWALNQAADRLPLSFEGMSGNLITGLDLERVEYRLEDQHYRVEDLSFRWQPLALLYSAVSVQSLRASAVELHLPAPAEGEDTDAGEVPEWPSLALPVRVELGGVDLRNIRLYRGETEVALEGISGTLSLGTFNLRVWDLAVAAEDYGVTLNGRTALRYPYDSNLAVRWHYTLADVGGQPMTFRGEADLNGDLTSVNARHRLNTPATLTSEVRFWPNLADADTEPQLVLDTSWPEQLLPPALFPSGWPTVETGGRLQLEGWLSDYRLELSADAQAQGFPELSASVQGRGNERHIDLEPSRLRSGDSRIETRGRVDWAPQPGWDLALTLEHFNPADLPLAPLAAWPGDIGGRLHSRGTLTDEGPQVVVEELALGGQLRALALALYGGLDYRRERLHARDLTLTLGANQLTVNGTLAQTLALQARLQAPILAQLDPALGGALEADIELEGDWREPRGRVRLGGEDLAWGEALELETLSAELARSEERYRGTVSAGALSLAGQAFDWLALEGEGDLEAHRLSARVETSQWGEVSGTLDGGYRDERWRGHLERLRLAPPDPLRWELDEPAPLTLSAQAASVSDLCLMPRGRWQGSDSETAGASPDGRLCLEGQWQAGGETRARADLSGLPLRLAQRWLQPEVSLLGTLEGSAEFQSGPQTPTRADLSLATRDGALRYAFGEEDAEEFQWEATELSARWEDGRLASDFVSDWGEVGRVSARLGYRTDSQSLSGRLQARLDTLTPLEALMPRLQEVGGALSADVELAGDVSQPELNGQLRLAEGTAKIPEVGLHLQAIRLDADVNPQRVRVTGSARSGEGELTLDGRVRAPWQPDRAVSATLSGERFQILNTRQLMVRLSPDLQLEMTAERIDLTGEALIPEAQARFKSLPESATGTSDDIVVEEAGEADGREGPALHVDLNLKLGDEVRFSGFGLDSRLSGELEIIRNPDRGLLTVGEVGVAEGRYTAYGQDLDIERGRLIFQGPYDNPGLDIRATREADDVTAGLEIGGTLQRPRSRVFSSPSLPDSEAMAILLTGKSLSNSSSADASMLVNAIGGLGLERSGFITAEIADTFSLDEFRIQAEDDVTRSSLHIGKYLTPRLFVRYVVGLFDQTNRIGLRYELTEGLRLEAESGLQQSIDMIYKFER